MACLSDYTLKGLSLDCNANLAGIKELYLGYNDDISVTTSEATHSIDTIEGTALYKYTFAKQTGSLTSTLTKDEANGTMYYTHSIELQFNKLEGAKHIEIEAMAAEALVGIVLDNNGKYWYIGDGGYLSADSTTAQTGKSYDELNGYTLTLSAMSGHLPYEIAYDKFSALVK